MPKKLLEIAADIVQTQATNGQLSSEEIVSSLKLVFGALQEMQKTETEGSGVSVEGAVEVQAPEKADPQASIQNEKVVCLECGAEMRQLTARHLAGHGLSLRAYRQKYGFSLKQPLSAKSLTKMRSKMAKKRGLPENLMKYLHEKRQAKAEAATPAPVVAPVETDMVSAPAKRTRKKSEA